jgi:hypothetical protein
MPLKKVSNVTVKPVNIGSFWRAKAGYEFQAPTRGSQYWYRRVSVECYKSLQQQQQSEPVSALSAEGRTWWWYQGEFYHENDAYTSEDVKLILWEREQKKTRKLERLRKEMLSQHALEEARREQIPEDVRIFVWNRDGGKCVECGSPERLEFDHIIPVSKGGSNTARNIQLLCEACNREKADHMGFTVRSGTATELRDVIGRPPSPALECAVDEGTDVDELVEEAVAAVRGQQRISAKVLQTRMGIGYAQAARLMDRLEEEGFIGPAEARGPSRKVLMREEKGPKEASRAVPTSPEEAVTSMVEMTRDVELWIAQLLAQARQISEKEPRVLAQYHVSDDASVAHWYSYAGSFSDTPTHLASIFSEAGKCSVRSGDILSAAAAPGAGVAQLSNLRRQYEQCLARLRQLLQEALGIYSAFAELAVPPPLAHCHDMLLDGIYCGFVGAFGSLAGMQQRYEGEPTQEDTAATAESPESYRKRCSELLQAASDELKRATQNEFKCPKCGAAFQAKQFCRRCGAKLR